MDESISLKQFNITFLLQSSLKLYGIICPANTHWPNNAKCIENPQNPSRQYQNNNFGIRGLFENSTNYSTPAGREKGMQIWATERHFKSDNECFDVRSEPEIKKSNAF